MQMNIVRKVYLLQSPIVLPALFIIRKHLANFNMIATPKEIPPQTPSRNVFVQNNSDKNMMTISFIVYHNNKSKQFNLYRETFEPLAASLERIRLNLAKLHKSEKKQEDQPIEKQKHDDNVQLFIDGLNLDPHNTKNVEAWVEGAVLKFSDSSYIVKTNCPYVESVTLPNCIMKNYSTLPNIILKNCVLEDCHLIWQKKISAKDYVILRKNSNYTDEYFEFDEKCYWYKLSDKLIYTPTDEDIGHLLKITCVPTDGTSTGLAYSAISKSAVEVGPVYCPFEKRQLHTREKLLTSHEFRVVSYNILADIYADSEYSRNVLFKHCHSFALDIDYRRQLLLKEIPGYHADIICLQEVDKKEFTRTYSKFFKMVGGYSGVYNTKGGSVGEGLATFYNQDKFEIVDSHVTLISELIQSNEKGQTECDTSPTKAPDDSCITGSINTSTTHPILKSRESSDARRCLENFNEISKAIMLNEKLKKRFLDRHSVLQTTLLKFRNLENKYLLVANTHLYFAPDADHIRLLQGSVCVKYLEYLKGYYKESLNLKETRSPISIVFCGDMNSTRDCGLYKLLLSGTISSDLPDWSSNKDEEVKGLSVNSNLRLASAYEDIEYTNYTPDFHGCLDYIYYESENVTCTGTIPPPAHEEVTASGGLPSELFPSDHLALIANFRVL